jgi:outer membrane biosynthesis protein TonB
MRQRVRRLGTASAAVSAGALVLVLAAPAADAAAEECKKGVDPQTTIENWKCNLGNLREALTPKSPTPTPEPEPTPSKTTKRHPEKTTESKPRKAPAKKTTRKHAPAPRGGHAAAPPAPSGPSTMTDTEGLKPYAGKAPSTAPGLPGILPTPEIAADPNAYQNPSGGTAALPRTRLVSPVAASGNDDQMLLVAAAAGAAGAVAALNLSVAGRALRRRREAR